MAYWFYMQLANLKSTDYLQYVLITIALKILSSESDCGHDVIIQCTASIHCIAICRRRPAYA